MNGLPEKAGNPRRYKNLFGVTLGTGFGGGIVRNGELFLGDNCSAAEIWLLRNKLHPKSRAEEGANIGAVRRVYAEKAGMPFEAPPEPKAILEIAKGEKPGDRAAAIEAFRQLGEVVGDAMGQALTLIDGLTVIGGGLSGAWPLFSPTLMAELGDAYEGVRGHKVRRLIPETFNLEEPDQLERFVASATREIAVPGSALKVAYDPLPRIGVGPSRLGTSHAVAIGAYSFALRKLDNVMRAG